MPPPPLSQGFNLTTKKPAPKPSLKPSLGQKRKKPIFDDDDDDDDNNNDGTQARNPTGAIEISTLGGLDDAPPPQSQSRQPFPKKITTNISSAKGIGKGIGIGTGKPGVKPLNKSSIFADEDSDDDNNNNSNGGQALPLGLNPARKKKDQENKKEYTNLSALHSSRKHAQEAQDLDPSIYSYDAVYDSLHAQPDKSKTKDGGDADDAAGGGVPKYMSALMRSAEIRKRDQLRARDRLLAKEREAEGEEFADKEKFVTAAYKAQQEELRRIEQEEEEREKAEEERKRRNGGSGMVGFYRDMLSRGEEKHEEVVKAAEEAAKRVAAGETGEAGGEKEEDVSSKEKTEAQKAAEMNARGANVAVNDEGQVVDKRQLLSAGLNVAPKPKAAPSATATAGASRPGAGRPQFGAGAQGGRAGQRARQTEMVAAQLEAQARQEAEAEEARQKEIAERSRSRKTEGDVSSARERFLARKREREAASKG